MDVIPVEKGTKVIQCGEEASWAGFLLDGSLDVLVGDPPKKVAQMGSNTMVGELAVLEGGTRTADCVAASDAVIGAISFQVLESLHLRDPELSVKLHTAFGIAGVEKLRARIHQIEKAGTEPSKVSEDETGAKVAKSAKKSSPDSNKQAPKLRRRSSVLPKEAGKIKRKRSSLSFGSNNTEVFYRSQVEKAKRVAKAAALEAAAKDANVDKALKKVKNAEIRRQKAEKEKENMARELAALRKFKAASMAIMMGARASK